MTPGVRARLAAILEHAGIVLKALEHAAHNRSGAAYHAATSACIRARDLFRKRVPGEETRSPILAVLGETELADRLRGLHDALQVAQNWMTAAGQLTHGPGDRFSPKLWKEDPEPSIDGVPLELKPAEMRFLNG